MFKCSTKRLRGDQVKQSVYVDVKQHCTEPMTAYVTCFVSNAAASSANALLSDFEGILNTALSVSRLTAALLISGFPNRMRFTAEEHPPHFMPETSSRIASVSEQGMHKFAHTDAVTVQQVA